MDVHARSIVSRIIIMRGQLQLFMRIGRCMSDSPMNFGTGGMISLNSVAAAMQVR
jgi:hypothetical protein